MAHKICPQCGAGFHQRKNGACPACGTQLELVNGKAITSQKAMLLKRERGTPVLVWEAFVRNMKRRNKYWSPPTMLSTAWKKERKLAGDLVAVSAKFIKYHNRLAEIDPTEFAVRLVDFIFSDSSYAGWVPKITSIQGCNGKVFWGAAPKVLKQIDVETRLERERVVCLESTQRTRFDVQYAGL